MSSPFQRQFSAKSPLNHMEPKDNPHNPEPHIHQPDDREEMKNEYGQTQTELLTKKVGAINTYENKVTEALRSAGFVDEEDNPVFPDQERLDRFNIKSKGLREAFTTSSDSIDRINWPNEIKRNEALKKLDEII